MLSVGFFLASFAVAAAGIGVIERAWAQSAGGMQSDLASTLRVVRPLMRENPQRAITMLERLEVEYPSNPHVLLLLGETYEHAGEYESARAAYERLVAAHPNHVRGSAYLGTLSFKMKDEATGREVFNKMLERTEYGINTYRTIGSTLARHGFYDVALEFYEDGRSKSKGNYILSIDIAYMHKLMGNFEGCLIEYLSIIPVEPRQHRLVRTKVLELMRDSNADKDQLMEIIRADAETTEPYRQEVFALLATIYLEEGALESAFDVALRAEAIGQTNGTVLYSLADQAIAEYHSRPPAERARYFSLAIRSLEAFLDNHPTASPVPRAHLMMVDLLVELAIGRVPPDPGLQMDRVVDRSMSSLDWLIETYPGTEYAEQAYLRKGDVLFRLLDRTDEALVVYNEGLRKAKYQPALFAERLGRVYLIIEEYDEAEKHFKRLVRSSKPGLRETGVYYSGLLLSFTGNYESARDTLTALAEGNPGSNFTNDAIELAWAIEDGLKGEQRVLKMYIGSIKAEVAQDTTGALRELRGIVQMPADTPLRKRSLFHMGLLYQASGKYNAALNACEQYLSDYATDIKLPDVQRRIGQIYEVDDLDLALDKYEDILLAYPHYIFLDEVRADVVRVRGQLENQP